VMLHLNPQQHAGMGHVLAKAMDIETGKILVKFDVH